MRVTLLCSLLSLMFIIEALTQRINEGAASPITLFGATFGMLYLMASSLHLLLHFKAYKFKYLEKRNPRKSWY